MGWTVGVHLWNDICAARGGSIGAICSRTSPLSYDGCNHGDDRLEAEMNDAALLAQGKALALIAAMLQRSGVISTDEFGDILGLFAVTVGEDAPDEGAILALWAGIVKESAY
jgi:hypothetical protein